MTAHDPPFDDACRGFAGFLASHGAPAELRWFCREDAVVHGRRVRLRASTPACTRDLYERYYRLGIARGRWVSLEATFVTDRESWCYVRWPEDNATAGPASAGGLLNFNLNADDSRRITREGDLGFALWRLLDGLRGPHPLLAEVPRRRRLVRGCGPPE